jgi:hypothetical protein
MQPLQFVVLNRIPMNAYGNADRKALKIIPLEPKAKVSSEISSADLTVSETRFSEQWEKALPY